MIVVRLMGGLGNQMFQYAAARSLSERLETKLYMDLSWFDIAYTTDTPRTYELNCFKLPQNFKNNNRLTLIEKFEPNLKSKVYRVTKGLSRPYAIHFIEHGHRFNRDFSKLSGNVYLEGWWQSEKYFKKIRGTILEDFNNRKPATAGNKKLLDEILKSNSISLHVRRGDYANNKNTNAFHGLMGMEYYYAAVRNLTKKVKSPHFFIFSDEPDWCRQNLKLDFPTTYVSGNKDGSEDMRLMRNCRHNVIANSSFSWWGAWLNNNADKIVIAPKRWFADTSVDTSDIIPGEWARI